MLYIIKARVKYYYNPITFQYQIYEGIIFLKYLACVHDNECRAYQVCRNKMCIKIACADLTCKNGFVCHVTNHSASCIGKF